MPLTNIKEMLEAPILGIIPEDKSVPESLARKNAAVHTHPKAKATRAYNDIATRILGKKILRKQENFYGKILKALGIR